MSVARMKKATLFGQLERKEQVLEWLQELGCVHLVTFHVGEHHEVARTQSRDNYEALRYLLNCPVKQTPLPEDHDVDLHNLVAKVLDNRERRRQVEDRIDELHHQIADLRKWGDFSIPPPGELDGLRFWFYEVPLHKMREVRRTDLAWQVVNRDQRCAYVVVVAEDEPAPDAMPVARIELPDQSLSELEDELTRDEHEREVIRSERQMLTRWRNVLLHQMVELDNLATLSDAADHTLDEGEIFVVQGWIPESSVPAVGEFAITLGVAFTQEDPTPSENPPVMLENPKPLAPGEDLIGFFQLPGYRDWDPSPIILVSFVLFFAMIFSDAGYGVVFGIGVAVAYRWLRRGQRGRRLATIGAAVAGVSIVYGVLMGSYFGIAAPPGSFLASLKILDINDFDSMMQLCVVIGAGHVLLGNAMTAWNRRGSAQAIQSLGWIAIVVGGMAAFFAHQGVPTVAWALMVAGGLAILAFSTDRPVERPSHVLLRLFEGLKALSGVTTVFGDVLSYLRLFALGLSSASLAITFNQLAGQMIETVPGLGILLAILIVIVGHLLNVLLCILGGLVHGLRLNLIEFYHWSVYGEGLPFRPFRKKETLSWTQ